VPRRLLILESEVPLASVQPTQTIAACKHQAIFQEHARVKDTITIQLHPVRVTLHSKHHAHPIYGSPSPRFHRYRRLTSTFHVETGRLPHYKHNSH
jgi:hypothetical protein